MVLGPFATWDYIKRISASIPTQRKIKDHVEAQINHFRRGKSHTDPDKEADVVRLQESYRKSKVHVYVRGRKLAANAQAKDYLAIGSDPTKLQTTIERWFTSRLTIRSTLEDHEPEPSIVPPVAATQTQSDNTCSVEPAI